MKVEMILELNEQPKRLKKNLKKKKKKKKRRGRRKTNLAKQTEVKANDKRHWENFAKRIISKKDFLGNCQNDC